MYQDERKLDFKPLGIAIKKAREAKGWTQEYLAQLVDLTPRSIMYIENRGQHPRLNKFYLITTLLGFKNDVEVFMVGYFDISDTSGSIVPLVRNRCILDCWGKAGNGGHDCLEEFRAFC